MTRPRWEVPNPYGYPAAIESMGSIAAPFFAGVSVALAVFVMQNSGAFGWGDWALLFLVASAFAFVATLQFTFWARQFAVTPPEMNAWWPDAAEEDRLTMLQREQRRYFNQHERWSNRARNAYDIGMLCFLLGAVVCLVPHGGISAASNGRLAVFALAVAGLVAEAAWIASSRLDWWKVTEWPEL
jgi:hypothetical protein